MIEIIFVITALVALICALITVSSHHVIHALLFMVLMMLALALIFFLLGAPFAAALQVIVYAGAIMMLFIFVTMMLNQGQHSITHEKQLFSRKRALLPLLLAMVLFIEVMVLLNSSNQPLLTNMLGEAHHDSTKEIGTLLFTRYYQLVILAALMLLSALVSAIHIASDHPVPTTKTTNNKEQSS